MIDNDGDEHEYDDDSGGDNGRTLFIDNVDQVLDMNPFVN